MQRRSLAQFSLKSKRQCMQPISACTSQTFESTGPHSSTSWAALQIGTTGRPSAPPTPPADGFSIAPTLQPGWRCQEGRIRPVERMQPSAASRVTSDVETICAIFENTTPEPTNFAMSIACSGHSVLNAISHTLRLVA
jgi:hypothetical protein